MLADSILSELYRLSRNRMAVFWSALFVPLLFVVGGIAFHLITKSQVAEMTSKLAPGAAASLGATNLGNDLVQAAGISANGAVLVFMLIGAATLYAGDYRWETWRLISARNSRLNLILGKVGAFKVLTKRTNWVSPASTRAIGGVTINRGSTSSGTFSTTE